MLKRVLIVTLIASCGLLALASPAHSHYKTHEACKAQQDKGDWAAFSYCMGEALDAPGGGAKTRSVVGCESGFDRFATSPSGLHRGLTQQNADYYPGRVRTYAHLHIQQASWIYSGRWNLVVAIRMAQADGTWAGHWPRCA